MRDRKSARVILFDQADRVLLIQARDGIVLDPARPNRPPYWITPGGKIEAGEAVEVAAGRELAEETGLKSFELGPAVWALAALLASGAAGQSSRSSIELVGERAVAQRGELLCKG